MSAMPCMPSLASDEGSRQSRATPVSTQRQRLRARTLSSTASESEPVAMETVHQSPVPIASRHSRRPTSYFNQFQTSTQPSLDDPPSYSTATRRPRVQASADPRFGTERLPTYSCSLDVQSKLLLSVESINPLNPAAEGDWKEAMICVRGTMLNIHRLKDGTAGKLVRSYTLQHAEVGLAPDTRHNVLVPQSRLAQLIPLAARKRAWAKDPALFRAVRQSILRIRVETDQILLADSSEERIHDMISKISAGIDIAHDIDERGLPRQCTMPRRRRRQRQELSGDLTNPALVAEQERILRNMFPSLAGDTNETQTDSASPEPDESPLIGAPTTATVRDEDDIDLAMVSEQTSESSPTADTPHVDTNGSESDDSRFNAEMLYATASANFNAETGKWNPRHPRTAAQEVRYVRRCMPVLHSDAPRASDVLICNGKRVKINWRMELLEDWELAPPSYNAHNFTSTTDYDDSTNAARLIRTVSHCSTAVSTSSAEARVGEIEAITSTDRRSGGSLVSFGRQVKKSLRSDSTTQKLPEDGNATSLTTIIPSKNHTSGLLARNELSGLMYCF